jgi:hypothetical protein
MSLKPDVHELCPKCGQIQARIDAKGVVWKAHNCPRRPPGPPNPPRSFMPGEVNFIPAKQPPAPDFPPMQDPEPAKDSATFPIDPNSPTVGE